MKTELSSPTSALWELVARLAEAVSVSYHDSQIDKHQYKKSKAKERLDARLAKLDHQK